MRNAPLEASLWAATAAPAPETSELLEPRQTDVVVIGAGYTGLSTALHLVQRGIGVAVIEAEQIGYGASGRNAGHCTPTFSYLELPAVRARFGPIWGERLIDLQTNAARLVFDLIRENGIECEAQQNGFLQVAHTPSKMAVLEKRCADHAGIGKAARLLGQAETETLTGSPRYHGGWLLSEAGHLNPLGYARGLARAAIRKGVNIYIGSRVAGIAPEGIRWRVQTAKGSVLADKVVIGTGAYTDGVWPGLRRSFSRLSVACMATKQIDGNVRPTILPANNHLLDTRRDMTNYRFDKDGRLVTTAFVEHHRGKDRTYTLNRMADRLRWLHPQLSEIEWEFYWYGDIDLQPSTFPRFFELAPGVTTAIGYSGRGVPTATAMGKVLADYASGTPAQNLSVQVSRLKAVPPLFGLVPRVLLPYHRRKDSRALKRDGIKAPKF